MAKDVDFEAIADKNMLLGVLLGVLPFLGYLYVGKPTLAVVNFITLNYLGFGFFVGPIHMYMIINNAREEVTKAQRQQSRQQPQQQPGQQQRQGQEQGGQQDRRQQQQRRNGQGRKQAQGQQPNRRQQE